MVHATVTRGGWLTAAVCRHVPITAAIRMVIVSCSKPAYVTLITVVSFSRVYTVIYGDLLFTGPVISVIFCFLLVAVSL